jgi:hypothetical protein
MRSFKYAIIAICFALFISGVLMLVYCRDPVGNRRNYNVAALSMAIALWLGGVFCFSFMYVYGSKLANQIRIAVESREVMVSTPKQAHYTTFAAQPDASVAVGNSSSSDAVPTSKMTQTLASLLPRLRALKMGALAVGLPFFNLLIAFPIAFHYLGSVPYNYIMTMLQFTANIFIITGVTLFLRKTRAPKRQIRYQGGTGGSVQLGTTSETGMPAT